MVARAEVECWDHSSHPQMTSLDSRGLFTPIRQSYDWVNASLLNIFGSPIA